MKNLTKIDTVAVYLNRDCPRKCPQCGISDSSKKSLGFEEWKDVFQIINDSYGTKFFLVLGVEPLLLGEDFVKLVKWWNDNSYFYGLYSTSPKNLFDKYKYKLLDAGVNNWSCGIDSMPGFPKDMTLKKTLDGMSGMKWMDSHGVQCVTVTTMTNYNLSYVSEIIRWCHEELPNSLNCFNPIEWSQDETYDFFSSSESISNLLIPSSRKWEVKLVCEQVRKFCYIMGWQIQNVESFLTLLPDYFDKLNYPCHGSVGMGIDADGSIRRCGYNKGRLTYSIWDVPKKADDIYTSWKKDVESCTGCFWNYIFMLEEDYESVIPMSKFFKKRWGCHD